MQAFVAEYHGNRVATVDTVQFFNSGLQDHFTRSGSVVVRFKDGPTTELIFKDCTYSGGLVSELQQLWTAH
ncbi:MAG: hypothetical protein M3Q07_08820 [Pseudobdellovibrionaceae bacterium]|nr:hypothetical protein [Pseudobdellovibrionaceae bacterium]